LSPGRAAAFGFGASTRGPRESSWVRALGGGDRLLRVPELRGISSTGVVSHAELVDSLIQFAFASRAAAQSQREHESEDVAQHARILRLTRVDQPSPRALRASQQRVVHIASVMISLAISHRMRGT
jgi:hypothetical protein